MNSMPLTWGEMALAEGRRAGEGAEEADSTDMRVVHSSEGENSEWIR